MKMTINKCRIINTILNYINCLKCQEIMLIAIESLPCTTETIVQIGNAALFVICKKTILNLRGCNLQTFMKNNNYFQILNKNYHFLQPNTRNSTGQTHLRVGGFGDEKFFISWHTPNAITLGNSKAFKSPGSVDKPGYFRYQYQHNLLQPFAD